MKKTPISLDLTKFKEAHASLKSFESIYEPIKVGKLNLSSYLIAHADFPDDSQDPKAIRTKRRILIAAGRFDRDPATLIGDEDLKDDLEYSSDEYTILSFLLNKLVKEYKPTSGISQAEMNNCSIVNDCVMLLLKKT
jgi:hypothetical protein